MKNFATRAVLGLSILQGPWQKLPDTTPAPLNIPKSKYESVWLESQNNVGTYIYKFKKPIRLKKNEDMDDVIANISWMVKIFPNTKPSLSMDKSNDDYPARIGFIFAKKGEENESLTKLIGLSGNRVISYAAVPEEAWNGFSSTGKTCGKNAEDSRQITCLKPATDKDSKFKVLPFLDMKSEFGLPPLEALEHQLVGVWLVFDSDNTNSKTSARLNQLQISWPDGAPKKTR